MKFKFKCGCQFDELDFDKIPLDCAATWDLINSGFTRGVFQLEGSLGKRYSKELKPRNIEELSDVISLIRPGCLQGDYREDPENPGKFWSITTTYQKVKDGVVEPEYVDECLRPIFEPTCGVPVYQEQIMRICTDFSGFSLERADIMRKCLHGDSYMWTPDGYFRIKELVGKSQKILSYHNGRNKISTAKTIFKQKQRKRCIKVSFDGGREIICTPDHEFLTNYGWVEAQNLTDNHFCIHELLPKYGTDDIDLDSLLITIGLVTEGYMPIREGEFTNCKKSPNTFVNKDMGEIERFREAVRNKFGIELKSYINSNGVTSLVVPDFIVDELGICRGLSGSKKLPDRLLRLPREKLLFAIAKLIDFDGWVENRGIFYTSKSKELAVQVMMLLESLGGVRAYIYTKEVDKYGLFYNVGVTDSRCLNSLRRLVGFGKKVTNDTFFEKDRNFTKFIVPNNVFKPIIEDLISQSGYTRRKLIGEYVSGSYFKGNLSIDRLCKILSCCGRSKYLEFFIKQNAYWNKVTSIDDVGMHDVYDFTMSSDRSPQAYVNSILVHNSIGKKKEDLMAQLKQEFIEGAQKNNHSKETAEMVFSWIEDFSGYGFNKCVSGDTALNRGAANQYSSGLYTVEHLYKLVNDYQYAKNCKQIPLRKKLRRVGYGKCMAVCPDGRIRPMPIKTIHYNGKKKLVRVIDNGGRGISCTLDHKFMTPDGIMKPIGEIGVGGQVVCHIDCYDDEYTYDYSVHKEKQRGNPDNLTDTIGRKNGAFIHGNWAAFKKIREDNWNVNYCQICLIKPSRLEWHHIDGDRSNNVEDNLIKLCVSCHKKEDYKLGRNKRFDIGHKTGIATIVSIEEFTETYDTYDVEMDTPEHNWVANGFTVSNSHGVSYAVIGYQTAYAKRHFPLQFFKSMLTHSDNKQDSLDEIQALVHEAKLFDIKITPPSLRLLNVHFAIQDETSIAFGLGHIKGVGQSSIRSIKRIAKINEPNEVLFTSFKKGKKVKKNVMEALIKSGALDYFNIDRINLLVRYKVLCGLTDREREAVESTFMIEAGGDILKAFKLLSGSKIPRGRGRKQKVVELIIESEKDLGGNKKLQSIGYEKFYLGIPLSGNEVELHNNPLVNLKCRSLHKLPSGTEGCLGVVIQKVKQFKDKRENWMCFLTVSDDTYMMDGVVVFSSTFKNYSWIIEEGKPVLLTGKKDKESFLVRKIEHL